MDERVRALLVRGREHYRSGEYEQAARCFGELAADGHPFADVFDMLGVIAHQRGDLEEAERMFSEALRLNPAYTEAALNLAVIYNDLGKYAEAREVYQRMLAARSGSAQAIDPFVRAKIANMHADVGHAYEEAGLFEGAIGEYRKALELCPTFADIRTRLGASLRAAGDVAGAVEELARVKAEKPRYLPARLHLGMAHFSAGRHDRAEREWREVLELDRDNKFAKTYLAMLA
jgi:tetratricopeptide (TPR) repeat protein